MKKYLAGVIIVLILAAVFFGAQKVISKHRPVNSGVVANSASNQIVLSYKISQVPNNHVIISGYDIYLVSNDETVTPAELGGGFDQGHPDYNGDYKLVSAKDGKRISDFAFIPFPTVDNSADFTDDMAHNGLQKFVDPLSGQELIKLYQYGDSNFEELFMLRVDNNGQIIPVNFYDDKGNLAAYKDTNYDGSVNSFFDNAKASIGVCVFDNGEIKTYCDEYEYKNDDFHLVKSKIFNSQPVLLK